MQRGEVWWVSFAGSTAGEIQKTRPAVIVSNNTANQYTNRVQVVPLTSKTGKLYPCEARITIQGKESKALADQLTTVSKERLTNRLAVLTPHEMRDLETAIRIQLALVF